MKQTNLFKQDGSVATVAVLSILMGMTLIVFFANRSLVFEQKTSANQYRSTRAMEAAEAGLEWALANLNYSTNIGTTCVALAAGTAGMIFRDRYLDPNNTGDFAGTWATSTPGCVNTGTAWICSCPINNGNPSFGSDTGPTFTVSFQQVASQPLMVRVVSTGCTTPALPCVPTATTTADSTAQVQQIFKLQSGLATPPAAPLTARGNVNLGANAINITNTDTATNGITINAGGNITGGSSATITSVPGTPAQASQVSSDTSLSSLTEDKMFQTYFGQTKTSFKDASTTTQVTCSNPCNSQITSLVASGSRVIWVNGDMELNSNTIVGSTANPVIIVADGNIRLNGTVEVYGVLYCTALTWNNTGGGTAKIFGAAIAEGDFTATGTPNPTYDPSVLNNLKSATGQFAKVPGSWFN